MIEAIVYFVASPDGGPQHRIYEDEDVQALTGCGKTRRHVELLTG
jgi:hypothetical protein